ncbi:MAG: Uma2 family endonuclease [Labilithrix sp.]|nr:Uma2 family endonuclease [Labilithrix sp.]MCW5817324.1 Uma2 family endonuclease [Labilithrix sp.]
MVQSAKSLVHRHPVPRWSEEWLIPEETVPESQPHDIVLDLLKALLLAFVARTKMNAQVARNLAVRFTADNPRVGVDPDLCLITPRTPEGDDLESLRLWEPGHSPPALAIEVVSASNAEKDYVRSPEKYASCGSKELWIFDPKLAGRATYGGPQRLQVWQLKDETFELTYAGEGPAFSAVLGAWLHVVDEGRKLRVADDREGTTFWPTAEESERAAKEAERAAKEAALARVAELEAELRRR